MSERVSIFCPDSNKPSYRVRQMYRMADLLNSMGHRASILHQNRERGAMPFTHSTAVEYRPGAEDWHQIVDGQRPSGLTVGMRVPVQSNAWS